LHLDDNLARVERRRERIEEEIARENDAARARRSGPDLRLERQ